MWQHFPGDLQWTLLLYVRDVCSRNIWYCINIDSWLLGQYEGKNVTFARILQKWFKGHKGLKTLRFEVLDFFIIQPKLDVNPACGVQKFSPLDVYEVFVFRDLKRTPGSAHNGKKSVYRPHISASKHLFLFSFQFPPHGYFLARVRGGPRYQMGQIFGKFPRGGGGHFQSKNLYCRFWAFTRGFFWAFSEKIAN